LFQNGKLVDYSNESFYATEGHYCLEIFNEDLGQLEFSIIKNNIFTNNLDIAVKSKCKNRASIHVCDCAEYKIIINEKAC
jgi:hypothetical protein